MLSFPVPAPPPTPKSLTALFDLMEGMAKRAVDLAFDFNALLWIPFGIPAKKKALTIRPITAGDEPAFRAILETMSAQDLYFRFHTQARPDKIDCAYFVTPSPSVVGFIAEQDHRPLGVAHAFLSQDGKSAEFSVMVAGNARGNGVGKHLTTAVFNELALRECPEVTAEVMGNNTPCLRLLHACGMKVIERQGAEVTLAGSPSALSQLKAPLRVPEQSPYSPRAHRLAL